MRLRVATLLITGLLSSPALVSGRGVAGQSRRGQQMEE